MVELTALLTTYNRASLLEQVLRSFTSQSLAANRYELVIIDDGSEDHTASVVSEFKASLPIRYFFQPNAGLAAARNHGLAVSQAPVILFMDDDDTIESATLAEHVEKHQIYPEPEVAVLGFTRLDSDIAHDPLMHFVTEISGLLFSYRDTCENKFLGFERFWGGRISCKREFILTSGGFNVVFRFGCEDIELGYRLSRRGLKILYNPRAISTMIRKLSFESFCNRLRRQGNSQYIFSRLFPEPEVQYWCQMPMFYSEWPALSEVYKQILDRARALDHWVRRSGELGLPLDQAILAETHDAYYKAFKACKLYGISEMRKAWQDPIDLGHSC